MGKVIDRGQRLTDITEKLALSGYRMSAQRAAILAALVNSPVHPSAEDVFTDVRREFPQASLATVYKTIDALKALAEVKMVSIAAGRAHYDILDTSSHPHVICTKCGRTEDVEIEELESQTNLAALRSGYEITEERLQFFGLCPICRADNPS